MSLVPANRVEVFQIACAANTAKASPSEVATGFGIGDVVGIELVIPDGHLGLTGIAFALAHGRVIPFTVGGFITGNDERIEWDLADYPDSGAWSVLVYNTDVFDHSWEVRYLIDDPRKHPLPVPVPVVASPVLV